MVCWCHRLKTSEHHVMIIIVDYTSTYTTCHVRRNLIQSTALELKAPQAIAPKESRMQFMQCTNHRWARICQSLTVHKNTTIINLVTDKHFSSCVFNVNSLSVCKKCNFLFRVASKNEPPPPHKPHDPSASEGPWVSLTLIIQQYQTALTNHRTSSSSSSTTTTTTTTTSLCLFLSHLLILPRSPQTHKAHNPEHPKDCPGNCLLKFWRTFDKVNSHDTKHQQLR